MRTIRKILALTLKGEFGRCIAKALFRGRISVGERKAWVLSKMLILLRTAVSIILIQRIECFFFLFIYYLLKCTEMAR